MSNGQPKIWRSALLLGLVAVIGTALLAFVHSSTRDRIAAQERRVVLEQLHQVIPESAYDNALHEDVVRIQDEAYFGTDAPLTVFRAFRGQNPVAAIMQVVAPDGYNGDIVLLVGIYADGRISGVRVVSHRETPGLGDPIERQRSDWILAFDGRSLDNPGSAGWAVKRDGGIFDQFTGATITPRAVVEAVERSLRFFESRRDVLFSEGAQATP